jgi:hypothetical protein
MSTIREGLHVLVDRLPPEKEERALKNLRHMVDCLPPQREETNSANFDELLRRHFRQIGQRIGLDVEKLPQNLGWTGGVVGDRVQLTKDWVSEDARHRLSQIDLRGQYIILLERLETVEGTKLRYEVRVFTDQPEGRAEVNLPIKQSSSQKG